MVYNRRMKHRYNINFDVEMFKELKDIARDFDVSISEVIRSAISCLGRNRIREIVSESKGGNKTKQ